VTVGIVVAIAVGRTVGLSGGVVGASDAPIVVCSAGWQLSRVGMSAGFMKFNDAVVGLLPPAMTCPNTIELFKYDGTAAPVCTMGVLLSASDVWLTPELNTAFCDGVLEHVTVGGAGVFCQNGPLVGPGYVLLFVNASVVGGLQVWLGIATFKLEEPMLLYITYMLYSMNGLSWFAINPL
jgi:hypothetical protein